MEKPKEEKLLLRTHIIVNLCVYIHLYARFIISRENVCKSDFGQKKRIKFCCFNLRSTRESRDSYGEWRIKILLLTTETAAQTLCSVWCDRFGETRKDCKSFCPSESFYGKESSPPLRLQLPRSKKKRNLCKLMKIYLSAHENHLMVPAANIYSKTKKKSLRGREREREIRKIFCPKIH